MVRRALLGLGVTAIAGLAFAAAAGACSCARVDPREVLPEVDAAVIGTALRSEVVDGRRRTHLQVERAFKADLGTEVVVDTGRVPVGGGDCSMAIPDGRRVGLYLSRDEGGVWQAGLCSLVEPDALERAAAPIPQPLGRGRIALIAALGLDGHRLAALDARGRLLAYGRGSGRTSQIEICPGARRLVEVAGTRAVVRRLPDLEVVRRMRVPATEGLGLECLDRAGRDLLVLSHDYGEPVARGRLLRYRGQRRRVILRGTTVELAAAARRGTVYLASGRWGRRIGSLDLRTGRVRQLATVPRIPGALVPSPNGRAVATVAYNPDGMSYAVVIRQGAVRRARLGEGALGSVFWLGRDRLLYGGEGYPFRLFDGRLRTIRRFRTAFASRFLARRGDSLFGIDEEGRLLGARLPGLRVRTFEPLPSTDVFSLVSVAGAPPLRAARAARTCASSR